MSSKQRDPNPNKGLLDKRTAPQTQNGIPCMYIILIKELLLGLGSK